MKLNNIKVMGHEIRLNEKEYVNLGDIAKKKNLKYSKTIVMNWLRNRMTIEFLGLWESINNSSFKGLEFESFRKEAGTNSFVMSPTKWVEKTNAIGIIVSRGKYNSGTYAHKDIALEFASWVSVEFKLYLIKEFQRLKKQESTTNDLEWNVKKMLTKINYRIHTNAIKEHLIPKELTENQVRQVYANEADVLNVALFGKTARSWKSKNKDKEGSIRDYANISQLVCLSNLESLNSVLIEDGIEQSNRLFKLNQVAILQMKHLIKDKEISRLN